MIQVTRSVVLIPKGTITASGTSSVIGVADPYDEVIIYLSVGTASGTSPTIDFYIQQAFKDVGTSDTVAGLDLAATTYTLFDDYAHFPQIVTAGNSYLRIMAGSGTSASNAPTASFAAAQDAALAASTVKAGPIGSAWRLKWVVGGTSPQFLNVYMTAQFLVRSGG